MQTEPIKTALIVYEVVKFWAPMVTFSIMAYKGLMWFRDIKTKDLPDLKKNITDVHTELQTQTTSMVNELKELRADMRAYFIQPKAFARAKKASKR